ncbi:MAG: glycosyltransferase [Nitriliruptoraceae bacterium]|nr:glycosyltransferase [Nitriliruptoraceae bacterium]
MTEASVRIGWAHPRPGGRLWLRCAATGGISLGAVPLSSADGDLDRLVLLADAPLAAGDTIATLQPSRLATSDEPAWSLVAIHDGAPVPIEVDSIPDVLHTASVIETPAGGCTIETSVDRRGRVIIRLRPRQPWLEVGHPRQTARMVTYHGRLAGLSRQAPPPEGGLVALLVDRDRGTEIAAAIEGTPPNVIIRIDLDTLPDRPGHHNLIVRSSLGDHRAGWHLDDVPAKNRSLATPIHARDGTHDHLHAHPRFTDRNNVVVTVSDDVPTPPPDDDRSTWEREHGELLSTQLDGQEGSRSGFADRLVRWVVRTWFAVTDTAARRRRARRRTRTDHGGATDLYLLLANRHAIGGTVRATVNMANALARHTDHRIHLLSVYQLEDLDPFALDDEVRTEVLVDQRQPPSPSGGGIRGWIRRHAAPQPTRLIPPGDGRAYRFSLWTDLVLARRLRGIREGVIIPTRAGLSIVAARSVRPGVRIVAQQHLPFDNEADQLRPPLLDAYRRCDAVTTLTDADATRIRAELGEVGPPVHVIPNSVEQAVDAPARASGPERILCVGRMSPVKGTDLLIDAFVHVNGHRPTTELRLVGPARRDRLDAMRSLALARGVAERISFLPATARVEAELLQATICVVPSRHEAFGMVIVEAMNLGIPVVAFDCPNGPREIITDGVDGLLVPPEDAEALADAMVRVLSDRSLREELSCAGRRRAADFSAGAVAARFDAVVRST